MSADPARTLFESLCFDYYQQIKFAGWSHPEEGDFTPESLFWRSESNAEVYGVHQIQAAWNGFLMAYRQFMLNLKIFGDALQTIAMHTDLFAGDDITTKGAERVKQMADALRWMESQILDKDAHFQIAPGLFGIGYEFGRCAPLRSTVSTRGSLVDAALEVKGAWDATQNR